MSEPTLETKVSQDRIDREISAKLCAAIMELDKEIPKHGRNTYAAYDYATADDVYLAVRAALAGQGLTVYLEEDSIEFQERERTTNNGRETKRSTWGTFKYLIGFELAGVGKGSPNKRTQIIEVSGPQSMQAAATYTQKYWLRGRMLLATGDADADQDKNDGIGGKAKQPEAPPAKPAKPSGGKPAKPAKPAASRSKRAATRIDWQMNNETGEITMNGYDGDEPTTEDVQRSLFAFLRGTLNTIAPDLALELINANKSMIDTIPGPGQKMLRDLANRRQKEAQANDAD